MPTIPCAAERSHCIREPTSTTGRCRSSPNPVASQPASVDLQTTCSPGSGSPFATRHRRPWGFGKRAARWPGAELMARYLLTIKEAAQALGVSERHIKQLIHEADCNRKSRWRFGREIVDMSPLHSRRRTLRINIHAVVPGLERPAAPTTPAFSPGCGRSLPRPPRQCDSDRCVPGRSADVVQRCGPSAGQP